MRFLLPVVCFFVTGCIHAQQSFPGINITPNGGNAGKINLRNSANVNTMFIQDATTSAAGAAKAINIIGATATDGRIILTPGNVAGLASVIVGSPNTSDPGLVLRDGGNSGAANGVRFVFNNLSAYLDINSSSGSPTYTSATNLVHTFQGNNSVGPIASFSNLGGTIGISSESIIPTTGSTYELGLSSRRWAAGYFDNLVIAGTCIGCPGFANPMTTSGDIIYGGASGTPTRLAAGTTGACLTIAGTPYWQFPCAPDPAWTSYAPTIACNAGVTTTSSSSAAYYQAGKTVRFRASWSGQCSASSVGLAFSLPVAPLTTQVQTLSTAVYDASTGFGGQARIIGGFSTVIVEPIGGYLNFPIAAGFSVIVEGIYQSN